jgi:hypothetical protein
MFGVGYCFGLQLAVEEAIGYREQNWSRHYQPGGQSKQV